LEWIPNERGGRGPWPGPRLVTPARFEAAEEEWPAWSLVLDFSNDRTFAEVSFLVPVKAPHHYLRPGNKFDLFEGPRLIAHGVIIDRSGSTGTEEIVAR
jgi:hypothetical protein